MIELFVRDSCIWCHKAQELLSRNGIEFSTKELGKDFTREWILEEYPNARTFPVVVIDGMHVGGYEALREKVEESSADTRKLLNE